MTLKYFEYGSEQSPTILFLHGLGVSSWMWQDQIEYLRQNFHCLAVDLPGNGDSFEEEWVSFSATAVTAIAPNAHHGWNGEFPHLFSQMVAAWVDNQPLPAELEVKSRPKKMATARL